MTDVKMENFELTPSGSHITSVVLVDTYNFSWTIENFKKLPLDLEIDSPEFSAFSNRVFRATCKKIDTYCDLKFNFIRGSPIKVTHNLFVKNGAGEIFHENSACQLYEVGNYYFDYCIFSWDIEVMECDYAITIECSMKSCEIETELKNLRLKPKPISHLESLSALSANLKSMYSANLHTDISLKVGDTILSAHKAILCARSPVFARMCETPMCESEKKVIEIPDLEYRIVQYLVEFLCTGVLANDDFTTVYDLYYAADKYEVSSLRKKCVDVLLSSLTTENACLILELADRHSDVEFKSFVMDFIKLRLDSVLKTDASKKLAPGLSKEVTALFGGNKSK